MGMFDFLDPNTPGNMGASANRYGGITGASGGGGGMSGMSPYIALALQALGGGLQGAGAAQAAGARGFGAGIGPGFAGAQVMQQRQQEALAQNRYYKAHTDEMQARAQEAQRQAEADVRHQSQMQQFLATLTPQEQQMAAIAPKEVIDAHLKQMFPDPVNPTSDMINYQYGKDHPDFAAKQERLKALGATNVSVGGAQIMNNQENAAAKAIGEGIGTVYNKVQDAGLKSSGAVANWDRLGSLLGQINGGKYTGTINDVAKSMQSWGFDPASFGITNNTGLVDAATAMSNQMALQLRNPSGGAGMPGAMSDPDRQFLVNSTASVETSKEAVPLMVEWQKKLARRDADVARIAREYKNSTLPGKPAGVIDDGVYDAIQKFADSHPLFDAKDAAKVQALGGHAPGASADPLGIR